MHCQICHPHTSDWSVAVQEKKKANQERTSGYIAHWSAQASELLTVRNRRATSPRPASELAGDGLQRRHEQLWVSASVERPPGTRFGAGELDLEDLHRRRERREVGAGAEEALRELDLERRT